jgi:hypothetical protein
MSKGLSGSTIKSWFQYRCERKTRYEMMNPTELAAVPVGNDNREKSWAVLGIDYENRVVGKLAQSRPVLLKRASDDALSVDLTNAFLRGEGSADHAAQVDLRPRGRPSFLAEAPDISLRRTFADLIRREEIDGRRRFTVIDIKATRSARSFHKTQVAYYALLLRAVLGERGIDGEVSPKGEIWRIADDGSAEGADHHVEEFNLAPYVRLVEEFVKRTLPAIGAKEVSPRHDATFFHVYFKCEQCSYLTHCLGEISPERPPARRDVSAVPGLSHESKRTLIANGITSVGALAAQGQGLGRADGAGWSLSRRSEQLVRRARALVAGETQPGTEEQTFLMPPRSDVAIYLLADHDPVDDGLATVGFILVQNGLERETIEVLPTADRRTEANALVRVFTRIIAELEAVDAHNAALGEDDPAALHAHIFLYEPAEASALQAAVKRHIGDPRVRGGLLHMVRLFPPEEIVPEPEFKGMNHLPATAVRSVVEQLLAVPATVSHDLRQVSQALAREGKLGVTYVPAPEFERPFSSLLSLEVSRRMRERKPGHAGVAEIAEDCRGRLRATRAIVEWLQARNAERQAAGGRPILRLAKKPFRLQVNFDPIDAGDLDVLKALELLENRAGMLDTLIRLAKPCAARRDSGGSIGPLRLLKIHQNQRTRTLVFRRSAEARDADMSGGTFGVVLSDGSPEMLLDPRRWGDLAVTLLDPRAADDPDIVRVRMRETVFLGDAMQRTARALDGSGWWLDQTFVDMNSAKAAGYLSYLAEEANP